MNEGIDYGLGKSNIDPQTGIRYGVISQHMVGEAWYDASEADYGEPTCPDCGGKVDESHEHEEAERDYWCPACKRSWWSHQFFSDEPLGYYLDDGEYKAISCLRTDVMLVRSPYFTYAQFCSPCAPGAGNLDHPLPEGHGAKCYCFGHDWFEDGKAPYRIWSVETGEEVLTNT